MAAADVATSGLMKPYHVSAGRFYVRWTRMVCEYSGSDARRYASTYGKTFIRFTLACLIATASLGALTNQHNAAPAAAAAAAADAGGSKPPRSSVHVAGRASI